jgi:hypothetical protein
MHLTAVPGTRFPPAASILAESLNRYQHGTASRGDFTAHGRPGSAQRRAHAAIIATLRATPKPRFDSPMTLMQ